MSTALPTTVFAPRRGNLFWLLQTGGWFSYFLLSFLAAMGDGKPLGYGVASLSVALCGFATTSVLRLGYRRLWGKPLRVMVPGAALMLVVATLVQMKLHVGITFSYCDDCRIHSLLGYVWYFASAFYLLLSWSGLYFGIKLAQQLQQQKETALRAANAAHAAQLRMLRYQLTPHFLFNTLNAISTLVMDDRRDTAHRMICSLSSFLRHSLESDPEQAVTLAEEVEALELYLDIERLRFGDRLSVVLDIEPAADAALVPSLILQPLVENAIKYTLAASEAGGRIELVARRSGDMLDLHVRDDGPGFAAPTRGRGPGVGLANTRERLRVLYGEQQLLDIVARQPRGTDVHLRLPFTAAAGG
ncbi:sensor histidine kinase [Stenotrophomonas sp. PD6]|uniref:sensor histidine kinase n=1 Tax=Stenotrophomonas sp. PD6 TaxID=3368612 RepID=UPI003B9E361C